MACFIRCSYEDAEIVDVGDYVITVRMLRPNVTEGFICDAVSPNYYSHLHVLFTFSVSNAS
ncbi:hypothetical protein HU200_051086 [Digitaria exilis]|uniref:Uncharacterized protein n=1 Tax=Digitaria exilis TaxID=1010633 RepID=A0A835AR63_9POAL|nr:hypothetical protein HU200_051086 [Digitaria exilis]